MNLFTLKIFPNMKKIIVILFTLLNIWFNSAYAQKFTVEQLKNGVKNIDKFIEDLNLKYDYVTSETRGEDVGYSFAENYNTYTKESPFWIFVHKYADGTTEIDLQFSIKDESTYTYHVNYYKANFTKIEFVEKTYCNCFVTTYQNNDIEYSYFKKLHEGSYDYHIILMKH